MGAKEAAADEWMYEMQEGNSKSEYRACNEAFSLFLEGMIDDAALTVSAHLHPHPSSHLSAVSGHSLVLETFHYIDDLVRRAKASHNPSEYGCGYTNSIPEYLNRCLLPN